MKHHKSHNDLDTKVFCIFGDERIFQSKSPDMFSAALQASGIKGAYVPLMVAPENIGDAVRSIRTLNIAGANVTVPYKEKVIPYLDEFSEGARIVGSINTIVRDGDMLKGYNTNAIGFMDTLGQAGFEPSGKSALVFGSGGVARAVVFMLNWLRSASVLITGRNEERIGHIANCIGGDPKPLSLLADGPVSANIVVNATSVSSDEEAPELAELVKNLELRDCELLIDLNYGRAQSFWQDLARSGNIPFMDGYPSLVNQARRTLSLWTGADVQPEVFLKAISD